MASVSGLPVVVVVVLVVVEELLETGLLRLATRKGRRVAAVLWATGAGVVDVVVAGRRIGVCQEFLNEDFSIMLALL